MDEAERITRIQKIHLKMKDKYAFTASFISQANNLRNQREVETRSIENLKDLNQIPK